MEFPATIVVSHNTSCSSMLQSTILAHSDAVFHARKSVPNVEGKTFRTWGLGLGKRCTRYDSHLCCSKSKAGAKHGTLDFSLTMALS